MAGTIIHGKMTKINDCCLVCWEKWSTVPTRGTGRDNIDIVGIIIVYDAEG